MRSARHRIALAKPNSIFMLQDRRAPSAQYAFFFRSPHSSPIMEPKLGEGKSKEKSVEMPATNSMICRETTDGISYVVPGTFGGSRRIHELQRWLA